MTDCLSPEHFLEMMDDLTRLKRQSDKIVGEALKLKADLSQIELRVLEHNK